jgi:hypothetical protein
MLLQRRAKFRSIPAANTHAGQRLRSATACTMTTTSRCTVLPHQPDAPSQNMQFYTGPPPLQNERHAGTLTSSVAHTHPAAQAIAVSLLGPAVGQGAYKPAEAEALPAARTRGAVNADGLQGPLQAPAQPTHVHAGKQGTPAPCLLPVEAPATTARPAVLPLGRCGSGKPLHAWGLLCAAVLADVLLSVQGASLLLGRHWR